LHLADSHKQPGLSPAPRRTETKLAAAGVELVAAAAHDLPLPLTFEPNQPHQELRDVALHLLSLSPSPAEHRSTAALEEQYRPPWLTTAAPLQNSVAPVRLPRW
jgi:hypothetical protein